MTELQLYKFVNENNIEWHRWGDNIIMFVDIKWDDLEEFNKLLGVNILDEEGLTVVMKDGYIAFDDMNYICDYFDINADNVFVGEEY